MHTLSELITLHTDAMGGPRASESVMSVEYHVQITEPSFSVEGLYVADRRGRMRIDIYAHGERMYTEAHDGSVGWQMPQDGAAFLASAAGSAALWHGTQFPGKVLSLHEMDAFGHHLEHAGTESINHTTYDVLKLTYGDGFDTYLFLDSSTFLIMRQRDVRALHPDVEETAKWIENVHEDYRSVEGVLRSYAGRQIDVQSGAVLQTSRVKSIRFNQPLADELFHFGTLPEK